MARPHTTLMLHSLARVKPQKSGKKIGGVRSYDRRNFWFVSRWLIARPERSCQQEDSSKFLANGQTV